MKRAGDVLSSDIPYKKQRVIIVDGTPRNVDERPFDNVVSAVNKFPSMNGEYPLHWSSPAQPEPTHPSYTIFGKTSFYPFPFVAGQYTMEKEPIMFPDIDYSKMERPPWQFYDFVISIRNIFFEDTVKMIYNANSQMGGPTPDQLTLYDSTIKTFRKLMRLKFEVYKDYLEANCYEQLNFLGMIQPDSKKSTKWVKKKLPYFSEDWGMMNYWIIVKYMTDFWKGPQALIIPFGSCPGLDPVKFAAIKTFPAITEPVITFPLKDKLRDQILHHDQFKADWQPFINYHNYKKYQSNPHIDEKEFREWHYRIVTDGIFPKVKQVTINSRISGMSYGEDVMMFARRLFEAIDDEIKSNEYISEEEFMSVLGPKIPIVPVKPPESIPLIPIDEPTVDFVAHFKETWKRTADYHTPFTPGQRWPIHKVSLDFEHFNEQAQTEQTRRKWFMEAYPPTRLKMKGAIYTDPEWEDAFQEQWRVYMEWVDMNIKSIGKKGYVKPGGILLDNKGNSVKRDGKELYNTFPDHNIMDHNNADQAWYRKLPFFWLELGDFIFGETYWDWIRGEARDLFNGVIDFLIQVAQEVWDVGKSVFDQVGIYILLGAVGFLAIVGGTEIAIKRIEKGI